MSSNSAEIIAIDDEIIDLDDTDNIPEDLIFDWDTQIRKKFYLFDVVATEKVLIDLMQDYLKSFQDMSRSFEGEETLRKKSFCHIYFLYSCYTDLHSYAPHNYLNIMVDILAVYCNLEMQIVAKKIKRTNLNPKKYINQIKTICKRILVLLTVVLLQRHEHIVHVLIKLKSTKVPEAVCTVLNILFAHFMTKVPTFTHCDIAFCRHYIVYQKWKECRNEKDWPGMDTILYSAFRRTPESVQCSKVTGKILFSCSKTLPDVVANTLLPYRAIAKEYFRHLAEQKKEELDDSVCSGIIDFNLDLEEDEPVPIGDAEDEDVTFEKAYYEFERNMSNLEQAPSAINGVGMDILIKCKQEFDQEGDDDLEIIEETLPDTCFPTFFDKDTCLMNKQIVASENIATPWNLPGDKPHPLETSNPPSSTATEAIGHVYDPYGLTTPPFEVTSDEANGREEEIRMYAMSEKEKVNEVQASNGDCSYINNYLTPPNETHLEEGERDRAQVYTDLGRVDEERHTNGEEFYDSDQSHDVPSPHVDAETTPPDIRLNPALQVPNYGFDTGQKSPPPDIPIPPPDIPIPPPDISIPPPDIPIPPPPPPPNGFNGSTSKLAITSDDFARFEKEYHEKWTKLKDPDYFKAKEKELEDEVNEFLSGPVAKPQKCVLSGQERRAMFGGDINPVLNGGSRSCSPTDLVSPEFESITDFGSFYANRQVQPVSIIKKSNSNGPSKTVRFPASIPTFKKNQKRVRVPPGIRHDKKLRKPARVVLLRNDVLERAIEKSKMATSTVRVDYNKSEPGITEKDRVRYTSPPPITISVRELTGTTGPFTVKNLPHLEKKPKKRKNDVVTVATDNKRKGVREAGAPTKTPRVRKPKSAPEVLFDKTAYFTKPFRMDFSS